MFQFCASSQSRLSQRRINGLQLPLSHPQVVGWIVFVITCLINFGIVVEIEFNELKIVILAMFLVLYVSHFVSHITASYIDPSEDAVRKLPRNNIPEFDRSVHAHVIENGRCHLCNIYTSSRRTKHCSTCNKCVDRFDHHCKWLNNCVGTRNYKAFVVSVVTALLISILTSTLCMTDILLFISYPELLSPAAQDFVNCTSVDMPHTKYCSQSVLFIVFLATFSCIAFAIACALVHLCCFHVYISVMGVTTYEYITKRGSSNTVRKRNCIIMSLANNFSISRSKERSKTYQTGDVEHSGPPIADVSDSNNKMAKTQTSLVASESNVSNLISVLINNELSRARKMFFYDKNKIHPQKDETTEC